MANVSDTVVVTNISTALTGAILHELFATCGTISSFDLSGEGTPAARCVISYKQAAHAGTAALLDHSALGDTSIHVKLTTLAEANAAAPLPPPSLPAPPSIGGSAGTAAAVAAAAAAAAAVEASVGARSVAAAAATAAAGAAPAPTPVAASGPALLPAPPTPVQSELSRTIYVGNLAPATTKEQLMTLFSSIGAVRNVKMSAASGIATVYAFVEFQEPAQAQTAFQLGGTLVNGRPMRIGPAENPISLMGGAVPGAATEKKRLHALDRVKEAQRKLEEKIQRRRLGLKSDDDEKEDDDGRDKESRRSRSSRSSRRRHRRSRSRSRSRGRSSRHRRRRSRSRSRDRYRRRGRDRDEYSGGPRRKSTVKPEHEGKFWDGFEWLDIPKPAPGTEAAGTAPTAP